VDGLVHEPLGADFLDDPVDAPAGPAERVGQDLGSVAGVELLEDAVLHVIRQRRCAVGENAGLGMFPVMRLEGQTDGLLSTAQTPRQAAADLGGASASPGQSPGPEDDLFPLSRGELAELAAAFNVFSVL